MTIIQSSVGQLVEIGPDSGGDGMYVRVSIPRSRVAFLPRDEFLKAVADLPGVALVIEDELPEVTPAGDDRVLVEGSGYRRQSAEQHRRAILRHVALLKDAEEFEAEQRGRAEAARREREAEVQKIRRVIEGKFSLGTDRDDFAAQLHARGLRVVEGAAL